MPVQLIIERIENEYRCLQMEYELGQMTEDEYAHRNEQIAMSGEWLVFVNELPSLY